MTAAAGYSGRMPVSGPKAIRSWSSVLAVQLQAHVEVLRAKIAALADLSTAAQPFEDLEGSLTAAMVAVLDELERVEGAVDAQLESLVTSRAHAAGSTS